MKDIDFDELDRAVSSVLGQKVPTKQEKKADKPQAEPVSDAETSSKGDAADTAPKAAKESSSETEARSAKPTPLAIKRRGKFMDVMHPSADMQPNATSGTKPHRGQQVIAPLATVDEPAASEPTAALDETHSLIGAEPVAASSELAILTDVSDDVYPHPDHGHAAESSDEPAKGDAKHTFDKDETGVADEETTSEPGAAQLDTAASEDTAPAGAAPQATPFLTDTQVEKRPLGAFGEADTAGELSSDAELKPAEGPAALPRELQPDVVSVESVHEAEAEQAAADSDASVMPFPAKVPVAPEANDGRVEGHPLFDTSTYHEPIAAVHSKSLPGWAKWVLGLAACLAIGAGVGYFLFTAGL